MTASGMSQWKSSRTGEETAAMTWRLRHDGDRWCFSITMFGSKSGDEQRISMEPDPVARTGNQRWWWTCPDCGRRCAVLFLIPSNGRFTCRTCGRVTYTSKQEASLGRMFARLGIDWPKLERSGR